MTISMLNSDPVELPASAILTVTFDREWHPVEWKRYPNQEPLVKFEDCGPEMPDSVLVRPRSLEDLLVATFWMESLKFRGFRLPPLVLPLVPGSRQDRMNYEGDMLCTLKSVAGLLNRLEPLQVVMLDPHSDVAPALINNSVVVTAADILESVRDSLTKYDGVIAPDAGAAKRAQQVAKMLGVPVFQAWKTRDIKTGALDGFGCEEVPAGKYLVVDDLCDAGGTFVGLATYLHAFHPDVQVDLYVTHGYFTKGTEELKKWFGEIITTDSVLSDTRKDVRVLNICSRI